MVCKFSKNYDFIILNHVNIEIMIYLKTRTKFSFRQNASPGCLP